MKNWQVRWAKIWKQIAADDYYDFWIVDMIKAPDWIIYMSTLLSWLFLTKNMNCWHAGKCQIITPYGNIESLTEGVVKQGYHKTYIVVQLCLF